MYQVSLSSVSLPSGLQLCLTLYSHIETEDVTIIYKHVLILALLSQIFKGCHLLRQNLGSRVESFVSGLCRQLTSGIDIRHRCYIINLLAELANVDLSIRNNLKHHLFDSSTAGLFKELLLTDVRMLC